MSDDFMTSPSGATITCRHCGTQFDNHGVDLSEMIPPVGDGCAICDPEDDGDPEDDA